MTEENDKIDIEKLKSENDSFFWFISVESFEGKTILKRHQQR